MFQYAGASGVPDLPIPLPIKKEHDPVRPNGALNRDLPFPTQAALSWVLNGKVLDVKSQPIIGASVSIKGTERGTSTGNEGQFLIEVQSETDSLVVSAVGYKTKTIVTGKERHIIVILEEDTENQNLDDVVVVAFGKKKKSELVGAQTVVNVKDLKIPSSNLTTAFAGSIPGMISYQRTGEPGLDNANFFIRGVTTFGYKVDPLILIDNIEATSNELARLQPYDIASFSIMKDATATSLYGSRAANGVILVTTREGKEGRVQFSLNLENSWGMNTKSIELADPITFMKLENESVLTRNPLGVLPHFQTKIDNTIAGTDPYAYPVTDWKKMMIKDVTMNQRAYLNVSGGGKIAKYSVSASNTIDNGNLKVDGKNNFNSNIKLNSYQLRSRVNVNLTSTTLLTIGLSGIFDDYIGPIKGGAETYLSILRTSPVRFPAFYPPSDVPYAKHTLFGNNSDGGGLAAGPKYTNPYAEMVKGYRQSNNSNMSAQLEGRQDLKFITKGLSTRFIFNTNRRSAFSINRSFKPFYYEVGSFDKTKNTYTLLELNPTDGTEYLDYDEGEKDVITTTYFEWAFDYSKNIKEVHQIGALVVGTRRNQILANQGSLQKSLPYRNQGVSGRVNYAYDSRYMVEFNFGLNGSERFHKSSRYGFFPSVGAAYSVSKEKFWDGLKHAVSNLKLRATYGMTGNDAIGGPDDRFFYLSQVNMKDNSRAAAFGTNYDYFKPGVSISRFANNDITWEVARKLNLGLDLTLFKSWNIVADYWTEKRNNILMTRHYIPVTMGLSAPVRANLGKTESNGVDISLDYSKSQVNWWYKARGNFTYATSKYTQFEEPVFPANEQYRVTAGRRISQQMGLIAERLFIDDADVANSPRQTFGEYGAGDIKYRDVNGDGIISDRDRVPIGHPTTPEIIYGFGASFGYKSFDISFFAQGSARSSFWINPSATAPFINQQALLKAYADSHWSEDNRNIYALWPRLSNTHIANNEQLSTWWMQNGAFLRLKTVEMGYNISNSIFNKKYFTNARLYANGLNLLNITSFKLWDIEMGGNGLAYPIQKVFNLGLTVNF